MIKSKVFKLIIMFFVLQSVACAKSISGGIESAIRKSDLPKDAVVSVIFKEIGGSNICFEKNSKLQIAPASVQKITTMLPSLNVLGESFEFKTQLYKDKSGNYYLKLAADPNLTTKDLKGLIRSLEKYNVKSIKAFYIDDSVLDSVDWGEGWQWDDDLSPLMPKFGAYNLDKNLVTVNIYPTKTGAPADISTDVFYPTAFVNGVLTSDSTNISLSRKNHISPDVITAEGTVSVDTHIQVPINHPRRYFVLRLEEILRNLKISYYGDFNRRKVPKDAVLVGQVSHGVSGIYDDILKKSNNMAAETVFKVAGAKAFNETGSAALSIEMFKNFYLNARINTDAVNVVDGSGVSKNNLMSADFVTNVLILASKRSDFECFKSHMAKPGEGTLTDRMLYFQGNLLAKTGTLSNMSAIAGYLTVKSGKTYAFCIITSDSKSKAADKKAFEEYVLREAFEKL